MKKSPKEYYYWWHEEYVGSLPVEWDMLSEDEQQPWIEAAEEEDF